MINSKFRLPDFKFYEPQKLEKIAVQISKETDKRLKKIAKNRFERSLEYFRETYTLKPRHYKVLSYYLPDLKENYSELYDLFIDKAKVYFGKLGRYYYHLKALLSSYYSEFKDNNLYALIKLVAKNNTKWKLEIEEIKSLLQKATNSNEFFSQIINKVNNCNSITEIEELKKRLLMNDNNKLLVQTLTYHWLQRLVQGYKSIDNGFCFQVIEAYLTLEKKKEVFEKVLLDNKDINNFDSLDQKLEEWFKLIGNTLGGPYGQNSAKWAQIDQQARDFFKRWKAHKNITIFFSEISGDQRRLDFWQQYSNYFYRVEYFEEYKKALLMESSDHVFIEFAGGGALHMYNKKDLNIQDVIDKGKKISKTRMVSNILKNKINCKERLVHHKHGWEKNFIESFSKYGYVPK